MEHTAARQCFNLSDHAHVYDRYDSYAVYSELKTLQMEKIKRAIIDEIGESFSMQRSAISGDKSCPLSVIFRLMTNIWLGAKVRFLLLNMGLSQCMCVFV